MQKTFSLDKRDLTRYFHIIPLHTPFFHVQFTMSLHGLSHLTRSILQARKFAEVTSAEKEVGAPCRPEHCTHLWYKPIAATRLHPDQYE